MDRRKASCSRLIGDGPRLFDGGERDLDIRAGRDRLLDERLEPSVDVLGIRVGDITLTQRWGKGVLGDAIGGHARRGGERRAGVAPLEIRSAAHGPETESEQEG